jgi:hypothetical protein
MAMRQQRYCQSDAAAALTETCNLTTSWRRKQVPTDRVLKRRTLATLSMCCCTHCAKNGPELKDQLR